MAGAKHRQHRTAAHQCNGGVRQQHGTPWGAWVDRVFRRWPVKNGQVGVEGQSAMIKIFLSCTSVVYLEEPADGIFQRLCFSGATPTWLRNHSAWAASGSRSRVSGPRGAAGDGSGVNTSPSSSSSRVRARCGWRR